MRRTRKFCAAKPEQPKDSAHTELPVFRHQRTCMRQAGHDLGAAILGSKDHMASVTKWETILAVTILGVTIMAISANAVAVVAKT